MDLNKMIAELQAERDRLTQAIEALERLHTGATSTRRGRPPAWLKKEVERNESGQEQSDTAD
jgi:DNA-binding protein H-NS